MLRINVNRSVVTWLHGKLGMNTMPCGRTWRLIYVISISNFLIPSDQIPKSNCAPGAENEGPYNCLCGYGHRRRQAISFRDIELKGETGHRVLHALADAAPETSGWRGPIEITWCDSVDMPGIPNHCKYVGGWFVLKSIAHGSKCPIEFHLPINVGRQFSWLMKTFSEFPLHLRDAANEVIQIVHVDMQTSGVWFVRTVNIKFTDSLPTFPIMKSLCDLAWSCC